MALPLWRQLGAAGTAALAHRTRAGALAGASLITTGAILERWSVFTAGFQSAADPRATVKLQRARMSRGTAP